MSKARIGLDVVDAIRGRYVEYDLDWCVVCSLGPHDPPRVVATCETSLAADKIKRVLGADKVGISFKVMAMHKEAADD